jgi:hypothetical protein
MAVFALEIDAESRAADCFQTMQDEGRVKIKRLGSALRLIGWVVFESESLNMVVRKAAARANDLACVI